MTTSHRTPLAAWLDAHNVTAAAFALLVRVHRGHLHHVATGGRLPGRTLALAIERETGGEVPASIWPETHRQHVTTNRTVGARKKEPRSVRGKRSAQISRGNSARRRASGGEK